MELDFSEKSNGFGFGSAIDESDKSFIISNINEVYFIYVYSKKEINIIDTYIIQKSMQTPPWFGILSLMSGSYPNFLVESNPSDSRKEIKLDPKIIKTQLNNGN